MRKLFLPIMDWDITWIGLSRWRPRVDQHVTLRHGLGICLATNVVFIPFGIACFLILAQFAEYQLAICATIAFVVLGMLVNTGLQSLSIWFWNQRATESQLPFVGENAPSA